MFSIEQVKGKYLERSLNTGAASLETNRAFKYSHIFSRFEEAFKLSLSANLFQKDNT
jgi:hypothetical protein